MVVVVVVGGWREVGVVTAGRKLVVVVGSWGKVVVVMGWSVGEVGGER